MTSLAEHPPDVVRIVPAVHDAVVFDMDGVITDTRPVHLAAWKRTLNDFLAEWRIEHRTPQAPFTDADYDTYVDGRNREDGVATFLASRSISLPAGTRNDGPDCASIWGLANRKDHEFHRALEESAATAFETSVALVRQLQARGLRTAIVSASRNCQQVLEAAGIGDLFAVRVDGIDAERLGLPGKPSPALFLEAARRCGAAPDRTVVVEDAIAGVQAGRGGSFALVIGVDRAGDGDALRANGADAVVTDLGEVIVDGGTADESLWIIARAGFEESKLRVNASLFTLADGRFGTSGAPLASRAGLRRWVVAGDVYTGSDDETRLLTGPIAMQLPLTMARRPQLRRTLDLHAGVLHDEVETTAGMVTSIRFSSLARPGIVAFRASCPVGSARGEPLVAPADDTVVETGVEGGVAWMRVAAETGEGIVAAAADEWCASPAQVTRIAAYAACPTTVPAHEVVDVLAHAQATGFDGLLAEHSNAWQQRWEHADIAINGDDDLQVATRFALFHLMSSVGDVGEAAVGARGLTGPGYRGHVFWDADTFVLPFLAATHPASARAMLEYRVRRLPAALEQARALGRRGARFPWESARSGRDVTPSSARDRAGHVVPIRTGQLEEHIVAQVAWAACFYTDWTGDDEFARGAGLSLLIESARYWASRVRIDGAGAHIYGVIGPDEYHEPVDDNAFTNVMARWNLRRAAAAVEEHGGASNAEVDQWRRVASELIDGLDRDSGVYEQFAGYFDLDPLIIEEVASRRPIAADVWLGAELVRRSQVIKQADVLMLHQLVPDEVEPASLEPNLQFYEPRTAHGSSLSPGVHASLFARAQDFTRALEWLRLTSRIDLDDVTETTASGLHLGAMGSLWQALVFGLGGLRANDRRLTIDPHLPDAWTSLEISLRFQGSNLSVRIEHDRIGVSADRPTRLAIGSKHYVTDSRGIALRREDRGWERIA